MCGFLPGGTGIKESTCQYWRLKRHRFNSWSGRSSGVGNGKPLHILALKNYGQRSLAGYKFIGPCKMDTRATEHFDTCGKIQLLLLQIPQQILTTDGGKGREVRILTTVFQTPSLGCPVQTEPHTQNAVYTTWDTIQP